MKVICAWHWPRPIAIGEKCPQCGEMAKRMPLFGVAVCWNRDCDVLIFRLDDQAPASHGICPDCVKLGRQTDQRVQELRQQARKP